MENLGVVITAVAAVANFVAIGVAIYRLGGAVTKFELIGQQQAVEIGELKESVKTSNRLITELAVQAQQYKELSARIERTEHLVDDLRRGEGFVLPFPGRPGPS